MSDLILPVKIWLLGGAAAGIGWVIPGNWAPAVVGLKRIRPESARSPKSLKLPAFLMAVMHCLLEKSAYFCLKTLTGASDPAFARRDLVDVNRPASGKH